MKTRDMLDRLMALRQEQPPQPQLTPDGSLKAEVHAELNGDRERQIALHERAFRDAQRHMRQDYALSRSKGHTKALFNNPKTEIAL